MIVIEFFIAGYYKIQTMSRQTVLQTMKMRKKRGDLQHLDTAMTSRSSGQKVGGNTPKWEATDKDCALVLWGTTQLRWTHTAWKI